MSVAAKPVVSIVVEGYNESKDQGTAINTIRALLAQDFPLDHVELILAGSSEQISNWEQHGLRTSPFHTVIPMSGEGLSYYELKNRGAELATGEIIVFTDSDVYPEPRWLSSLVKTIRDGADVSVGLSLFKDADSWRASSLMRYMAVSCTFGYILGPIGEDGLPVVRGFMDHNVAVRAEIFRKAQYKTEFGRVIASPLLFLRMKREGARIRFAPRQAIAHYFGWAYWLRKLHFRYGFEVHRLRRLDATYPNQWIRRTGPLEPLITMAWHMMLDVPRWLRFCHVREIPAPVAYLTLPLLVCISAIARGTEVAGMYNTMIRPEAMRRYAESV